MSGCRIIVMGASAGGIEALTQLVKQLPEDLPAALFIALHVPAYGTSVMPSILTRARHLPACHPRDGQHIQPGHIYVAPPNHHLLVWCDRVRLSLGPRENGHRPAVDTLFRSAAQCHGKRVVGIVLSGTLDDGTAGLAIVKARGGTTIAQDPEEALFSGMPRSAIENVEVDYILKVAEIADFLQKCADLPIDAGEQEEPVTEAALAQCMSVAARGQNRLLSEAQFNQRAEEAAHHAALLRQVIIRQDQERVQGVESEN